MLCDSHISPFYEPSPLDSCHINGVLIIITILLSQFASIEFYQL